MRIAIMFSMILPLVFSSCGSRSHQSETTELRAGNPPKPLIIGMAGYSTCSGDKPETTGATPKEHAMFKHLEDLAAHVKNQLNAEPAIVVSCFTNNADIILQSSLTEWSVETPTDEDYFDRVHNWMRDYSHIYVVGHSYGGWLAMKLVEGWDGSTDTIKSLHTIDPISKSLCFFNNPAACVSAPQDIQAEARQHIREHTNVWVNPWQRNTFFLHSSAIPQADHNPLFNVTHWTILSTKDIWTDIRDRVTN